MKVGDYVRFNGEIAKIIDIKRYKTKEDRYIFDRILDLDEDRACNDNVIYNSQWKYFDNVKSSPNIIDLIEVGDYVNGMEVTGIGGTRWDKNDLHCYCEHNGNENWKQVMIPAKDIKSIVTKEQFEAMQYKVGE